MAGMLWKSGNVTPNFSTADQLNQVMADTKPVCDSGKRQSVFAQAANLCDVSLDQLCPTVSRPVQGTPCRAALGNLVSYVVGSGAQEKVVWSNTELDIATVQDMKTIGNRTARDLPRQPMSALQSSAIPDVAITGILLSSQPNPALTTLVNVRPKPGLKWASLVAGLARLRAVTPFPSTSESRTAVGASDFDRHSRPLALGL
jgi:hypothetical protein